MAIAADASVVVSPASRSVTAGEVFSLDYAVSGVAATPGIGGYVIAASWNPAVLEMLSFSDGNFVPEGGNIVVCGTASIDNTLGQAAAYCSTVLQFGAPGVSTIDAKTLATSTFRARAAGASVIDLEGSYLQGPGGELVATTFADGSVSVVAAPAPSADATSMPAAPVTTQPSPPATPPAAQGAQPATSTAVSTFATGRTLSSVEAPVAGSGAPANAGDGGIGRLIAAIAAVGLLALGTGATFVYRFTRERRQRR